MDNKIKPILKCELDIKSVPSFKLRNIRKELCPTTVLRIIADISFVIRHNYAIFKENEEYKQINR